MDDRDQVGAAYLGHLTDADLRELAHAGDVSAALADARIRALRGSPGLVLDVLDRPAVSAGLLSIAPPEAGQRFTLVSPFLVFAAAIHRIAADLAVSGYAPERTAPRLRVPVFDGPQLSDYLAGPAHRLYLAELLTSFARSSGGVIVTRTPRGTRRHRWNDLDLGRLAMLLGALPAQDRPPVWRRLGDLAMFLTGVFPAAIERALAGRLEPARLARTTGLPAPPEADLGPAELFEWFGAGWYRLAASRASGSAATGLAAAALAGGEGGSTPTGLARTGLAGGAGGSTEPAPRLSPAPADAAQAAGQPWTAVAAALAASTSGAGLRDIADHFHVARRVLNAAADRYLFPAGLEWFTPPA